MMDPAQQPTNSDMREFPRRVPETPRRQDTEEALRYREFFDLAPDAYFITDAAGNIREANVAAGRMLGIEPQFLSGKPLPAFFDQAGRKQYRQQLDKLRDLDHLDDWEIALHRRNGERVAVSVSIARPRGKAPTGHRWILRDISRQHKAESDLREEAESALWVKADFLALLSHEFRTPLQAIFGYTELLERQIHGPLNESQLRDLRRIQQSQQLLLRLITTILDFARLESGKDLEVDLGPTVVHDVLGEMEGFVGSQLEQCGLSYGYHCSDERTVAFADPAKLQQIVLNLLANAIKFTPREGHIALQCEEIAGSVVIKVIDSGIGIPADKLETVFQPFVQIRNQNSRSEGTGLGLPISRRLATAMGGMLTATSVEGSGSIFTLRLPAIRSNARRALASG